MCDFFEQQDFFEADLLTASPPTGVNSKSARVLLLLVVPGQLVFLYTISLLQGQEAPVSVAFTVCYLCAALLQVDRKHT